jgi:hypothetical protein
MARPTMPTKAYGMRAYVFLYCKLAEVMEDPYRRTRLQSIMSDRLEMAMLQQAQSSSPINRVMFIFRYCLDMVVTS